MTDEQSRSSSPGQVAFEAHKSDESGQLQTPLASSSNELRTIVASAGRKDENQKPYAEVTISSSTLIAGRDVNVHANVNVLEDDMSRILRVLKPSSASHESATFGPQRSTCIPGTRVEVLKQVESWVKQPITDQGSIYILDGVAGSGKSTIARTVAENVASRGECLVASFFFRSNEKDRNSGNHVYPTLAYQLANQDYILQAQILRAAESDPDLGNKKVHHQFTTLFLDPLIVTTNCRQKPILIILDAIDECLDEHSETILSHIYDNASSLPMVKFLITTRPENRIVRKIESSLKRHPNVDHHRLHLHDITESVVEADIRRFINFRFAPHRLDEIFSHMEVPWRPTDEERQKLYKISGHLFIVAATIADFVLDDKISDPSERLSKVVDNVSQHSLSQLNYAQVLDQTYIQILKYASSGFRSIKDDNERSWQIRYQTVIGATITLQYPLPCPALSILLGTQPDYVTGALLHLHSLVAPSYDDQGHQIFRLHHKTFSDFITSETRIYDALKATETESDDTTLRKLSSKLYIDWASNHQQMVKQCFRTMRTNLKRNMANLSSTDQYKSKSEILNDSSVSKETAYACLQWSSHLSEGGVDGEIVEDIKDWAAQRILSWVEVLSLLDKLDEGFQTLVVAIGRTSPEDDLTFLKHLMTRLRGVFLTPPLPTTIPKSTHALLLDTVRLIHQSGQLLKSVSPMHIYRSVLAFAPTETTLYKQYIRGEQTLRVLSGQNATWNPSLAVLTGPRTVPPTRVVFSPSCSKLITIYPATGSLTETIENPSITNTVIIREATTGSHHSTLILRGPIEEADCVILSPDGSVLVSRSNDRTALLWSVPTASVIANLTGHTKLIGYFAFAPDSSILATGSKGDSVRLWNAQTGEYIRSLDDSTTDIDFVVFSPDASLLASTSNGRNLRLWSSLSGSRISPTIARHKAIKAVQFSPDGSRLVWVSERTTVHLLVGTTGREIAILPCRLGKHCILAFSPDGSRLTTASEKHAVNVWDAKTGSHAIALESPDRSQPISSLRFSPDGRILAATTGRRVTLWNVIQGTRISVLPEHKGLVCHVLFSPDSSRIATASEHPAEHVVNLWEAKTGSAICTFSGHISSITSLAFSPDSTKLASASYDCSVRLWSTDMVVQKNEASTPGRHYDHVTSLHCSPYGHRVISGSADTTTWLYDGDTGQAISCLFGHTSPVVSLAFSPDGSIVASASGGWTIFPQSSIQLWRAYNGDCMSTLDGDSEMATSVPCRSSGILSLFSSGSGYTDLNKIIRDNFCRSRNDITQQLDGFMDEFPPNDIVFSPDGKRLASIKNGKAHLWDVYNRHRQPLVLNNLTDVTMLTFSANGSMLAGASSSRSQVIIWDGKSGSPITTLRDHRERITAIHFSPDSSTPASASGDGTIRLYNMNHPEKRSICLRGHKMPVRSIAFSPDGEALVSTSSDKTLHLWAVLSGTSIAQFGPKTPYIVRERNTPIFMNFTNTARARLNQCMLLVVQQTVAPHSYGLAISLPPLATAMVDSELLNIVPLCWFPTDVEVWEFSANPTTWLAVVGCGDGRVLQVQLNRSLIFSELLPTTNSEPTLERHKRTQAGPGSFRRPGGATGGIFKTVFKLTYGAAAGVIKGTGAIVTYTMSFIWNILKFLLPRGAPYGPGALAFLQERTVVQNRKRPIRMRRMVTRRVR